MKILVTGADGQLGMSLRKISGEYPAHEFFYADLPECDIADSASVEAIMKASAPAIIINCAAYTVVDRAESDPAAAERVNAIGPEVLAAASKRHGAKLIHISTDYVFDGLSDTPYAETDPVNPAGVYGRTKLAGEDAVRRSCADGAIIRTSWLYSEYGNNFVKTMLRLADERSRINVVNDQTGSPTYAPDLARAVMAVAERDMAGLQVYHYCNGGSTTWYELAHTIFRLTGRNTVVRPVTTAEYGAPAPRPAYSVLDTAKIRSLGVAVPDWEDSLEECLRELNQATINS